MIIWDISEAYICRNTALCLNVLTYCIYGIGGIIFFTSGLLDAIFYCDFIFLKALIILSTEGDGDAEVADEDDDDECYYFYLHCFLFLSMIDFEVGDGECFDYFLFCKLLNFVLI